MASAPNEVPSVQATWRGDYAPILTAHAGGRLLA